MADKLTVTLCLLCFCISVHICRLRAAVVLSGRSDKNDLEGDSLGSEGDSGARTPGMWRARSKRHGARLLAFLLSLLYVPREDDCRLAAMVGSRSTAPPILNY